MWLGLEGWRSKRAPGQGKHRPGFLTCWARKAGPIRTQLSGTHMQLGRWRSHFQWPPLTQHGQPDSPVRDWGLEDAVELQISHSVLFCSVLFLASCPRAPVLHVGGGNQHTQAWPSSASSAGSGWATLAIQDDFPSAKWWWFCLPLPLGQCLLRAAPGLSEMTNGTDRCKKGSWPLLVG